MDKAFRYSIAIAFFLFVQVNAFSQLDRVDKTVTNYPSRYNTYQELANQINRDFKSDYNKAKAAFAWIAKNVEYKTKGINKIQRIRFSYTSEEDLKQQKEQFRRDLAQKTIRSKKALCEGYSTLYQEVCTMLNIDCVIIPGTAKRFVSEIGNNNLPSNHAWNAVKINGNWQLVDITWAAGSVDYSKMQFMREFTPGYFACNPKEFAMKHFPDDIEWLLLPVDFSKADFASQPSVFNDFIGHNYQILSPKEGLIRIKRGNEIEFSFQNIPEDMPIAYHFKRDKFGQLVKPIRKKNHIKFTVPTTLKGNDELIIYFNNEAVLGYKVNVK